MTHGLPIFCYHLFESVCLKQQILITILVAGSPRYRYGRVQVQVRALFLLLKWTFSHFGPYTAFPLSTQRARERDRRGGRTDNRQGDQDHSHFFVSVMLGT
jgi:hypothetical protein